MPRLPTGTLTVKRRSGDFVDENKPGFVYRNMYGCNLALPLQILAVARNTACRVVINRMNRWRDAVGVRRAKP